MKRKKIKKIIDKKENRKKRNQRGKKKAELIKEGKL